jgi:hypothetical protein
MKWFKHDSNAHIDAKLKKVKHKYGIIGYGLYWYCIELIAGELDGKNISFELEEDAETIALEWNLDQLKVQEIMQYMVAIGLFENSDGRITCLKLAHRLDDTNSKNPEIRKILEGLHSEKLRVTPSNSESLRTDKTRLDKNRLEEVNKELSEAEASDLMLAKDMFSLIKLIMPKAKEPNYPSWAKDIRLMRERDGLDHQAIADVFAWANHDSFWSTNILSPKKLREHFPRLHAASMKPKQHDGKIDAGTRGRSLAQDLGDTSWAD